MHPELAAFLHGRVPDFSELLVWGGGKHRLRLSGYLTTETPPDAFVLSGRALIIDDTRVLVMRNPDGDHLLPGGRREGGESTLDALHREVLEESGWSIEGPSPLAVLHLHHETPEPSGVGRIIYPDFLWRVFTARPGRFDPSARQADEYELGGRFEEIRVVRERPLDPYLLALLDAATR